MPYSYAPAECARQRDELRPLKARANQGFSRVLRVLFSPRLLRHLRPNRTKALKSPECNQRVTRKSFSCNPRTIIPLSPPYCSINYRRCSQSAITCLALSALRALRYRRSSQRPQVDVSIHIPQMVHIQFAKARSLRVPTIHEFGDSSTVPIEKRSPRPPSLFPIGFEDLSRRQSKPLNAKESKSVAVCSRRRPRDPPQSPAIFCVYQNGTTKSWTRAWSSLSLQTR
jgi:hypothetical protein